MGAPTYELTTEDQLEIRQLISQYSFYEDTGDAEAWGSLFTSEGRFIGSADNEIIGRDKLVEFARKRWKEKPKVHKWLHWVSNVVISPGEHGAKSQSYQMTVEVMDEGYRIVKLSAKSDEIRKEGGKWLFHIRRVVPMPLEPQGAGAGT